tara:strand:+ start:332 stop:1204 length:873 start_codon:yes stop_codon:yes gene_type:complete
MVQATELYDQIMSGIGLTSEQLAEKNTYVGGSSAHMLWNGHWSDLWKRLKGLEKTNFNKFNIQLGNVTEKFNIIWQAKNKNWDLEFPTEVIRHPDVSCIGALVDAIGEDRLGKFVIDAKHTHPYRGDYANIESRLEDSYYWQAQNNMLATGIGRFCLTAIAGNNLIEPIFIDANWEHQEKLVELHKEFWWHMEGDDRCPADPASLGKPKIKSTLLKVIDMSKNNLFVDLANDFHELHPAEQKFKAIKEKLKKLVPDDAKEVHGGGLKIVRNKAGSLTIKTEKTEKKKDAA